MDTELSKDVEQEIYIHLCVLLDLKIVLDEATAHQINSENSL